MRKSLLLFVLIAPMVLMGFATENSNHQDTTTLNSCSFTYSQGFEVGSSIGSSETYYGENYQMYQNTLEDFSHCTDYVAGVQDGYNMTRYRDSDDGGDDDGPIDPIK